MRIELWPGGDRQRAVTLGEACIANVTGASGPRGDYKAVVYGRQRRDIRHVEVKDFPRKRLLAWDLLYRVLQAGFGSRNGMGA